jgi:tetratricopeptide (TPR) repeat protein
VELYVENMGKLAERFPDDVKVIAGHGRDYTMDEFRERHRMTVATAGLIRQAAADGKTAQDMLDEDLLKDWGKWETDLIPGENWITRGYESLTGQARTSICAPFTRTIVESGIWAAIEQYHALKQDQPDAYDFTEDQLNTLGYQLKWRDMTEAAEEVFKLNIAVYPEAANPYDSLGELYMNTGDDELAIKYYKKALAVNPDTPSAIDALKRLGALEG